jgi:hypothetical protein
LFCDVNVPVVVPGTVRTFRIPDNAPLASVVTLNKH